MNLYYLDVSPPCRTVLLLGKILGLEFNLKTVNIQSKDQLKKEFLDLNPTHTVPTIQFTDSNLVLWESRVILTYLVNAFGKDEHAYLYPNDVDKRAIVDLYLQFDLSTLYQRMHDYFFPTILLGAPLDETKKAKLAEGLRYFENMLKADKLFATGNDFTIADLSLCITVSQIEAFNFDMLPYPKVRKWLALCKHELEPYDYDEINTTAATILASIFRSKLRP
ncbi:hypothetical protein PVAND_003418 [Polypedilum vanderplanki]|uniref:glutathione transferase n=1 Tax=Polypedilum vanderplanki TaxID=319348 RepID=A0A9J6BTZ6_POLVA|nr:hypothetical protein PVAND_003418 [Polypedilum vanderplanki]